MATKPRSTAIASAAHDQSGEVPDWARPGTQEGAPTEEVVEPSEPLSVTPAVDTLIMWLQSQVSEDGGDERLMYEAIVREALESSSMEQVFRERLPVSASDFVGVPLLFESFVVRESDYDDEHGPGYYISMSVQVGDPPESRIVNIGGWKPCAQVAALDQVGIWPMIVKVVEAGKAKKGKQPPLKLDLVRD